MKRLFIIILLLGIIPAAMAQTMRKATAAESKSMIQKINSMAASIKTISCSFTQEKSMSMLNDKMTSRGVMYYTNAGKLRWEYTSPYSYIFVINNNKVTMKSGNKKSTVDMSSNKLFQAIARIMVSSVTGKSLSNSRDFDVTMYCYEQHWTAHLVPKEANMKKMFKYIRLFFNTSHTMVFKVEIVEKNGDTTTIRLKNIETNKQINNSKFSVN
ncbi:MAG: outer membrane lipoprotein carrier protein LolA [Muribaculaceae bacterium]|nr:outer membrane lipoprotein carrier protein LolA [Muribaculaceae bacterium]